MTSKAPARTHTSSRRFAGLGLAALALCLGPLTSANAQTIEQAVDQLIAARGLGAVTGPGCAINVVKDGAPVFAKAYGMADIERRAPFRLETVSESGSVAKQFTAAAVLMLAEDGKLSLDDDVRKYLPELPDYGVPIRIADLLHHASGIREWSTLAALRGYPRFYRKSYEMDDLLKIVAQQATLNFSPGTAYEYSNSNYGLLAIVIGRVSGMSAAEFGRQRIFKPLGMDHSQWRDDQRRIVFDRAIAYRKAGDGFEQAMPFENIYGHGALLTTVSDLQRWNKALIDGELSPAVTRGMLTVGKLRNGEARNYAGGVFVESYRGHRVVRHSGITAGYTSQLWGFPDDKVSVALLCNVRAGNVGALAGGAADAALGLEPPKASPAGKGDTASGPAVFYRSASGSLLAIQSNGERRFADLYLGSGPMELIPAEVPGEFTTREFYGSLALRDKASDSVVIQLETAEPVLFKRESSRDASPAALTGLYYSAELQTNYEVKREAGGYVMRLADTNADDPLSFRLERTNGDSYIAHVKSRSGSLRDPIVTFRPGEGRMNLSFPADLSGVNNMTFKRQPLARAH